MSRLGKRSSSGRLVEKQKLGVAKAWKKHGKAWKSMDTHCLKGKVWKSMEKHGKHGHPLFKILVCHIRLEPQPFFRMYSGIRERSELASKADALQLESQSNEYIIWDQKISKAIKESEALCRTAENSLERGFGSDRLQRRGCKGDPSSGDTRDPSPADLIRKTAQTGNESGGETEF
jgi:hypothetical protein